MTFTQPNSPAFHIMVKPGGAICNLDCEYCYFLSKELLYPGSRFRMARDLLETYIRQHMAAQPSAQVVFAWQGGEPTLMGLGFFELAVALQRQYRRPGQVVQNTLQTNGTTLTDEWCRFFAANDFLIGISLDGPRDLHDAYRVDKGGQPTFDAVMHGLALLRRHAVEFNVLTTVHAANANDPLVVYRFLRDEAGARHLQFIPIVVRDNSTGFQEGMAVTAQSVSAADYGRFLVTVFDEWVRNDVGLVFIQLFEVSLRAWSGLKPGLCIFDETCGTALALEHNGDVYSCDHYVEPNYRLGNIQTDNLIQLVSSEAQQQFGLAKRESLPAYCRRCEVRFVCNGGCPKDRILMTPEGEPGLNYLCAGYKTFFTHINTPMRYMAWQLQQKRSPATVMNHMKQLDHERLAQAFKTARRNDACPCGNGLKFKQCHGRKLVG